MLTIRQLASLFMAAFSEVSNSEKFIVKSGPGHSDSKELRLYKAKDKVYEIGTKLGLAQYLIDAGKRLYTLAFNKNFI